MSGANSIDIDSSKVGLYMRHDGVTVGERLDKLAALSYRQLQIAELVSLGHTNRQIARTLSLSEKTVETHLSRAFAKLGVVSRAALAAMFTRMKP